MFTHEDLRTLQGRSLKMQGWIRQQTFSPENEKTLRRFSSWEVAELILGLNQSTFRGRLAADPTFPAGKVEPDGRQRWFSLDEVNTLRRKLRVKGKPLLPERPPGRAFRTAIANFKGGAGKSTVALHFAHAAALDGYRVLCVDFDPQATLSHSMGLTDVSEEQTVWGIMARDLVRETDRMNAAPVAAESGTALPRRTIPTSIRDLGLQELRIGDFIRPTNWPTIDIIPSCANAAFVEFASAQYRHLNPEWSFFAAVSRYLDRLPDDEWDLIFFDCPPAIGYQSMNAVFAADMLVIPSGPGYWEYELDHQLHRPACRGAGGPGGGIRGHLPRGEGRAAQDVPRRPLPADALRARQRPAPRHVRGVRQGVRRPAGAAPDRDDPRGGAVGPVPELGLRDRLPADDARDLAARPRHLRPRLARVPHDHAAGVGRAGARGGGAGRG